MKSILPRKFSKLNFVHIWISSMRFGGVWARARQWNEKKAKYNIFLIEKNKRQFRRNASDPIGTYEATEILVLVCCVFFLPRFWIWAVVRWWWWFELTAIPLTECASLTQAHAAALTLRVCCWHFSWPSQFEPKTSYRCKVSFRPTAMQESAHGRQWDRERERWGER